MKKLLFIFLFIPIFSYCQSNSEKEKTERFLQECVYDTTNKPCFIPVWIKSGNTPSKIIIESGELWTYFLLEKHANTQQYLHLLKKTIENNIELEVQIDSPWYFIYEEITVYKKVVNRPSDKEVMIFIDKYFRYDDWENGNGSYSIDYDKIYNNNITDTLPNKEYATHRIAREIIDQLFTWRIPCYRDNESGYPYIFKPNIMKYQ